MEIVGDRYYVLLAENKIAQIADVYVDDELLVFAYIMLKKQAEGHKTVLMDE